LDDLPGKRTFRYLLGQIDIDCSARAALTKLYPEMVLPFVLRENKGSPAWCSAIS
jgi:hypothetical protein